MRGVCRKVSWRHFLPGWRWLSNETPGHRQLVSLLMASCSVTQSGPTLCDSTDCSSPGFPVLHCFLEFAQTNVCRAGDAVQSSHPLSPPFSSCLQSFPALCLFVQDLTSSTRPLGTRVVKSNMLWIPCRASTSRTSMVVDFQSCLGWNLETVQIFQYLLLPLEFVLWFVWSGCSMACPVELWHTLHPSSAMTPCLDSNTMTFCHILKAWLFGLEQLTLYNICMLSGFSCIWLCVTLWTVAHQAPLSMGFSRQEYWSGLPCPPLGTLPVPGIKSVSHWQAGSLPLKRHLK